jgi:hypothetical protein
MLAKQEILLSYMDKLSKYLLVSMILFFATQYLWVQVLAGPLATIKKGLKTQMHFEPCCHCPCLPFLPRWL